MPPGCGTFLQISLYVMQWENAKMSLNFKDYWIIVAIYLYLDGFKIQIAKEFTTELNACYLLESKRTWILFLPEEASSTTNQSVGSWTERQGIPNHNISYMNVKFAQPHFFQKLLNCSYVISNICNNTFYSTRCVFFNSYQEILDTDLRILKILFF